MVGVCANGSVAVHMLTARRQRENHAQNQECNLRAMVNGRCQAHGC